AGIWSTLGPFWALPPMFLSGTAAAAGIALINSLGNLGGGFPGAAILGGLQKQTGSYKAGLLAAAAALMAGACLALCFRLEKAPLGGRESGIKH
ncbi:MAG: MFS transporter, partial [Planctomycetota bacterium]